MKADTKSKIITRYEVTPANVHDSQVHEKLIDEKDRGKSLHGDSAYSGEPIAKILEKEGVINKIHEKGYQNKPLTKTQKSNNKKKSKTRVCVEHIYGFMKNSMNADFIRCMGK